MTPAGFPHSDIHGSTFASNSPWLFAGSRVLHRLLAPRHPPCALSTLTSTRAAGSQARVRCRNSHGVRFEPEVPLGNPGLSTSTARVVQFPVARALSDGFFARRLRRFEVVREQGRCPENRMGRDQDAQLAGLTYEFPRPRKVQADS
jgi:hypothetical protein